MGADHGRRPVVGRLVARGRRRSGPRASSSGSSSRRSTGGPGLRCGSARTGSSCSPPPCSSSDRRQQERASSRPWPPGEEIWCQGWSEPDAGSDLAGIRSRADRDARLTGGWLLIGQKTWASRGAFADWCFGLFRTDPEAERHRGPDLLPRRHSTAPGVTVRPDPPARRRDRFRRAVLRGRRGARRPGARRGGPGLARGHGHGRIRAGPVASAARPATPKLPPGWSTSTPNEWPPTPERAARSGRRRGPGLDRRRGLPAQHPVDRDPGASTAARSGPRPAPTRSTGRRPTSPSTGPPSSLLGARSRDCSGDELGAVAGRLPLRPGRAHLRRHQRDPAQRGGRAHARPAPRLTVGPPMHFAFTAQQLEFRDAVAPCWPRSAPPPTSGRLRVADGGHTPVVHTGRARRRRPGRARSPGRPGPGHGRPGRCCSRKPDGWPCPNRWPRPTALAAPAVGRPRWGGPGRGTPWPVARRHRRRAVGRGRRRAAADRARGRPDGGRGRHGADLFVLVARGAGRTRRSMWSARTGSPSTPRLPRPHPATGRAGWTPAPETRAASGPEAAAGWPGRPTAPRWPPPRELLGSGRPHDRAWPPTTPGRHQFGKPIGSFQAVKHLLAGAQVKLEFARPVVYAAAWALDEGEPTARRPASAAKALASDAATEAARVCPAGPRGHRLHLGVRPPPLPQAGLGPGRGLGIGLGPPPLGAGLAHRTPAGRSLAATRRIRCHGAAKA